jgi:hypothetical protein
MIPLTQTDLLSHADYETQRTAFRQEIIALKKRRRIEVGPLVTLIFENRETLRFQIQEMIRVERIFEPTKIQQELDMYNALLPCPGELSATLMIEITDDDRIKPILDTLQGIDQTDTLCIRVENETIFAQFEAGHSKEDKISAVHFIRFSIPEAVTIMLQSHGTNVAIKIIHENYKAEAHVPNPMRKEWLKDLKS